MFSSSPSSSSSSRRDQKATAFFTSFSVRLLFGAVRLNMLLFVAPIEVNVTSDESSLHSVWHRRNIMKVGRSLSSSSKGGAVMFLESSKVKKDHNRCSYHEFVEKNYHP
mmetsp:Transcript_13251/g.22598  ORF Transcript_13251/g.22598 Transcript_13251/m.22598 type:complete len:109 (-) Transcript_13251:165-491(-)